MKSLWPFLPLVLAHAAQESLTSLTGRPLEVILERPINSSICEVLAIRKSQTLRGIPNGDVYSTELSTTTGGRRYSFISYDEGPLSAAVQSVCDNTPRDASWTWDGTDTQAAFRTRPPTKSPPLHISPLIQSGPSSNRVDLVFFGDGCKSWCRVDGSLLMPHNRSGRRIHKVHRRCQKTGGRYFL